jgi:hypothetical protein
MRPAQTTLPASGGSVCGDGEGFVEAAIGHQSQLM